MAVSSKIFKWAAAQELVPVDVYQALLTVAGLRKGKTEARENDPVRPIAESWMKQTIPRVSRQVAGMIRLMHTSGMRPGEAVIMRGCDLDTSGTVWVYRPQRYKTQHHGHDRIIYFGPSTSQTSQPWSQRSPPVSILAIARNRREPAAVRLSAWREILDRGHGRPRQSVEIDDDRRPMTKEELEQETKNLLAEMRAQINGTRATADTENREG